VSQRFLYQNGTVLGSATPASYIDVRVANQRTLSTRSECKSWGDANFWLTDRRLSKSVN